LLRIINEVLDFSRIETGNLHLEVGAFPLQTTLYQVITELDFLADQKNDVALTCYIDDDVPTEVMGDVSRLRQVLINLVGNALKFTEMGEVTLRAKVVSQDEKDVVVQFTVQDTGIGIPKDRQTQIFEAFVQADGSTTRKYGGTGLGLAIASQIVERMEGKIWVDSEVGNGSQFHFTARFGTATGGAVPLTGPKIEDGTKEEDIPKQLHILVAEDNVVNQRLALKLLEKQGHEVVVAGNGREALDEWAQGDFDLILMDMQMPEMDGFEATQKIRSIEQTMEGRIPIVAMTAHAMVGDRERCLAAGMDDYISKPIHVETLTKVIRDLFRAPQGSSE
jgi:CheY-like chemotaxis protein